METPSSTKRVTRSQTLLALNNGNNNSSVCMLTGKIEESETGVIKSRRRNYNQQQQDRSALIDITNDSPIVGLAMDSLETPSSTTAKQRGNRIKKAISSNTPGSGEALLRCQVKSLLQKVEEEAAADLSKIATENRPFLHLLQGFVSSPMGLVAPTPANTPQVPNVNEDGNNDHNDGWDDSFTPLPVIEEQLKICQVVSEMIIDGKKQESQKSLTRSLMLDFSEKSEVTDASSECSSLMTSFDDALTATSESKGKSSSSSPLTDDDSASNWSIQGNASIHDDDDDEEEEQQLTEEEDAFYYHPDNDDDDGLVDELCEGIGKMKVSEDVRGKHTRFVYNSDDEIVEAEEVLHLKGLPTPKGKHLRFPVEEEEH